MHCCCYHRCLFFFYLYALCAVCFFRSVSFLLLADTLHFSLNSRTMSKNWRPDNRIQARKRARRIVLVVSKHSCQVGQCHDRNQQQPSTCPNSLGLSATKRSMETILIDNDDARRWDTPLKYATKATEAYLVGVCVGMNAHCTYNKPFLLRSESDSCHHKIIRLLLLQTILKRNAWLSIIFFCDF